MTFCGAAWSSRVAHQTAFCTRRQDLISICRGFPQNFSMYPSGLPKAAPASPWSARTALSSAAGVYHAHAASAAAASGFDDDPAADHTTR
jgi:hypothetical protein